MKKLFILLVIALWHFIGGESFAHFGIVIPSSSTIMTEKESNAYATIAFAHPFTAHGLHMAMPQSVFLTGPDGKHVDLLPSLTAETFMDHDAWKASFKLTRPGAWQLAAIPQPYFEPSENCFIIHYTKTVIGAFGSDDGWAQPLGLPMEIVPLTRPFANYAGNTFAGVVLQNGAPLANATVEVEFLNTAGEYVAPNEYFETLILRTDKNGNFVFTAPWAGWWGFAALGEGTEKMKKDGIDRNVETGAVIWLEFINPAKTENSRK